MIEQNRQNKTRHASNIKCRIFVRSEYFYRFVFWIPIWDFFFPWKYLVFQFSLSFCCFGTLEFTQVFLWTSSTWSKITPKTITILYWLNSNRSGYWINNKNKNQSCHVVYEQKKKVRINYQKNVVYLHTNMIFIKRYHFFCHKWHVWFTGNFFLVENKN